MSEQRDRRWRLALGAEEEMLQADDQRLSNALTLTYFRHADRSHIHHG